MGENVPPVRTINDDDDDDHAVAVWTDKLLAFTFFKIVSLGQIIIIIITGIPP